MPNVIDVILDIAKKAGIPETDAAIVALSQHKPLAEIPFPEELEKAISTQLISLESAKGGHPDIKKTYFSQAYDGLDKELARILQDEKLPEDVIKEYNTILPTQQRATYLIRKIKEAENKKAAAGSKDKEEWANKIAELNELLRVEKDGISKLRQEYEGKLRAKDMNVAKKSVLSAYKTTLDDHDEQTKQIIMDGLIQAALAEQKAALDIDAHGQLQIMGVDGNPVFGPDHRALTPKAFFDKLFSEKKLLKVNDSPTAGQQPPRNGNANPQQNGSNGQQGSYIPGKQTANSGVQALNEQAIRDMEAADNFRLV